VQFGESNVYDKSGVYLLIRKKLFVYSVNLQSLVELGPRCCFLNSEFQCRPFTRPLSFMLPKRLFSVVEQSRDSKANKSQQNRSYRDSFGAQKSFLSRQFWRQNKMVDLYSDLRQFDRDISDRFSFSGTFWTLKTSRQ
jgi:hypothetical protein